MKVRRRLSRAPAVALVGLLATVLGACSAPEGSAPAEADESTASAAVVLAVTAAGETVLTTWARPGVPYARWWKELRPLLTARAKEGYAHTDPRRLPTVEIIGGAQVVPGPTASTLTVSFPTSQGRFGVALHRRDDARGDSDPWQAEQIVFPGQESMFE